nr:MAG TPA: hypothetical protein [Caudoviricetes sp.]
MLNAERFKKEILENSNVVSDFSMSKDKHTIKKCLGVCKDCFFHEAGDHCSNIKVKWLLSECKEPIKLSKLEYDILKYLSDNTRHMYIVRDGNGDICLYDAEPKKSENGDWWVGRGVHGMVMFNELFQFIKWEDSTPTPIKDVLDNCEVVNDAEE